MKERYSEADVIKGAGGGDPLAQRYLYECYRTRWYMMCLRYLPNKSDAEDALQNALVHIFGNLDQFDPALGEFGAWSSKIVAHDCLMIIRKHRKSPTIQEITYTMIAIDSEETPLEKLSREDLIGMIKKLPEGYRTVFNMYVLDGFSHKEIAQFLHISEGTSKSQLFKARRMLQEALEVLI